MNLIPCKTFMRGALLALAVVLPAASASAQVWPLPAATPNTDVLCTASPSPSLTCAKFPGTKTLGYPAALSFAGRFADAENTPAVQWPIRTMYAKTMRFVPERNRVYAMLGSTLAAYRLDSFMTRLGGREALISSATLTARQLQAEYVLYPWDAYTYPEQNGSGWQVGIADGQERLFDLDVDDRGYVYAAYTIFGWGIMADTELTGAHFLPLQSQQLALDYPVTNIAAFKSPTTGIHYALVGGACCRQLWNVENVRSPVKVSSKSVGFAALAKNAAGTRIAIRPSDQQAIQIYDIDAFIAGGSPITAFSPSYVLPASDGKNFYAVLRSSGSSFLSRFSENSAGSYDETKIALPTTYFTDPLVRCVGGENGYLTVSGTEATGTNVRVYKLVPGSDPVEISLAQTVLGVTKPFFSMYYSPVAPLGYVSPAQDYMYSAEPFMFGGKVYVAVCDFGLGDVWQIKDGDTLLTSISSFGTGNSSTQTAVGSPAAPSSKAFYGDTLTLAGSLASGKTPPALTWMFGDGGTAATPAPTTPQATTSHRYSASAAQLPLNNNVTATSTDGKLTATLPVSLAKPVARIAIPGQYLFSVPSNATKILVTDRFADASDGSVEGHSSLWQLDNAAPVEMSPTGTFLVGQCGSHNLAFSALYGANRVSFPASPDSALSVSYNVWPYVIDLNPPVTSDPTYIGFTSGGRHPANYGVHYKWSLLDGLTPVVITSSQKPPGAAPDEGDTTLEQIPPFAFVPSLLVAGRKVTLEVTASGFPTTDGGTGLSNNCANFAAQSAAFIVPSPPNPSGIQITPGTCQNAGGACTVSMLTSGQTTSGWNCSWTLNKGGVISSIANGPCSTFPVVNPVLPSTGDYVVNLEVTNSIRQSVFLATPSFTVAGALCDTHPTEFNVAVNFTGSGTCRNGGTCSAGEIITLSLSPFQWTPAGCEIYNWSLPAGASFVSGSAASNSPQITMSVAGQVQLTVTNPNNGSVGHGSATINFLAVQPQPQPQPQPSGCDTHPSDLNVGINFTGTSASCHKGGTCSAGETITLSLSPFQWTAGGCETYNWTLPAGASFVSGSSTSASPQINVTAGGQVLLTVTNPNNGSTGHDAVAIALSVPPCSSTFNDSNVGISFTGSGSCHNGGSCVTNEAVTFSLAPKSGFSPAGCETYLWTFPDGTTSTAKTPLTKLSIGGQTTLQLTNSNTNSKGTAKVVVPVGAGGSPQPVVDFTFAVDPSSTGGIVTFRPLITPFASGSAVHWDYGDGTSDDPDSLANMIHTFKIVGTTTYNVVLTVTVPGGNPVAIPRPVIFGTFRPRTVRH